MLYVFIILITVLLTVAYQNIRSGNTLIVNRNLKLNIDKIATGLLIILILSLLCGLRAYSIGTDTNSIYLPYYYDKYCVRGTPYDGTEYVFYLIIKAGHLLLGSYTGVLFLISFLTLAFAFVGLSHYKDRVSLPLAMLLYLSFIYFESFNIMRQMLAISIIIFAFRYLEKRKYMHYLFWCVVAAFVHHSSIVSIGLFIICLSLKNKFVYRLFIVFICLLPLLLPAIMQVVGKIPVLNVYFERYGNFEFDFSIKNLSYVIYFLPAFLICLYFRKGLIAKDGKNKFYLIMLLLVFVCGLFKLYMVWVARLLHYFAFSVCVLLPQCINLCKNNHNGKLLNAFIIIYCLAYFVLFYLILGNGDIYPYVIASSILK